MVAHYLESWRGLVHQCQEASRQFRDGIAHGTPKLNAFATESLVVHLINGGYLAQAMPGVVSAELARGAGDEPDVRLALIGGETARLQVKSTGPTTWQRAGAHDALADFFVWANLGPFCAHAGEVHLWVLSAPGRFLRAGLDWRSERQFARLTQEHAVCLRVPLTALRGGSSQTDDPCSVAA